MAISSVQYSTQFNRGVGYTSYSASTTVNGNTYQQNNPYSNPLNGNSGFPGSGLMLSSKAQMMMAMMSMFNSMLSGNFGGLMNMLNGFQGVQHPGACGNANQGGGFVPAGNPGFGQPRAAQAGPASALNNPNVPGVAPGQVKEMKAGETVRGAHGSVTTWNPDGKVTVDYKDPNGQAKHIDVKDGMVSFDGGQPQKLENVGQLLKLPNGDVVGLGNNPGPNGKQLVRVVMADDVNKIKTEPASATNIYDVNMMQQQQTRMEGGGYSMNVNAGSVSTPWGQSNYMNASMSYFMGVPVTHTLYGDQMMAFNGVK